MRSYEDSELSFGQLVEGTFPQEAGQILLPGGIAKDLGLAVGDSVSVQAADNQPFAAKVSGLVQDSAKIDDKQAYLLTSVAFPEISGFLSETDPFLDASTTSLFEQKLFTYNSLESLKKKTIADASATHFPQSGTLLIGLWLAYLIVLGLGVSVLMRALKAPMKGLASSGVTARQRTTLILLLLGSSVAVASLLGISTSISGLWIGRSTVSSLFLQAWSGISLDATLILLPVSSVLLAASIGARPKYRHRSSRIQDLALRLGFDQPRGAVLTSVVLIALSGLAVLAAAQRMIPPESAVFIVVTTLAVFPWAFSSLLRRFLLPPALRKATKAAAALTLCFALFVSTLLAMSVAFTARAVHNERTATAHQSPTLPPGSMALDSIPADQADDVTERYLEKGGSQPIRYSLPLEDVADTRITSPAMASCMSEHDESDPFTATDLCGLEPVLRYVVLSSDIGETVLVSSELVDAGEATFLLFQAGDSFASKEVNIENAAPDDSLVQPLAGAVIGKDSSLVEELGLKPSELRQLVFTDFGALEGRERAELRSYIARIAPGAEMVEIDADGSEQRMRFLLVLSMGSAFLATVCVATGIRFALSLMRETRGVMSLFSASQRLKRRLTATVISLWVAAIASGSAGGLFVAWLVSAKDGLGSGFIWAIAPGTAFVALAIGWFYWRYVLSNRSRMQERYR
ncbi:hypothetical protein [Glutamicibacter sp.]|uniref:hypothetical protein n=1 Tax=Glutamicibacter sp. TaxID=1931995 RepID=UPI002B689448|nr:hypothetical protein [Glutamicibacter sp.]